MSVGWSIGQLVGWLWSKLSLAGKKVKNAVMSESGIIGETNVDYTQRKKRAQD